MNDIERKLPISESTKRRNPHLYPGYLPTSKVGNKGDDNSIVQKQENNLRQSANNKPKAKKVNAANYPKFRVTIVFRFPDYIRRDADGCLSTLFDCIVHARRRLLDENS